MRCADFRPMVSNKSLIAIETVMNNFLFPCKTAISFCIPLGRVFFKNSFRMASKTLITLTFFKMIYVAAAM